MMLEGCSSGYLLNFALVQNGSNDGDCKRGQVSNESVNWYFPLCNCVKTNLSTVLFLTVH
jgi:hypothetical protein